MSRSLKPVVLGEFGFGHGNPIIMTETDKSKIAGQQEEFFKKIILIAGQYYLSGLIVWDPVPAIDFIPGTLEIENTGISPNSPDIKLFGPPERIFTGYIGFHFWLFYHDMSPMPAAIDFKNAFVKLYFQSYGGPVCDNIVDEKCVNGGDNVNDITYCKNYDNCVYNNMCFLKGTYADLTGDGKIDGFCMTNSLYKNMWRDCDNAMSACNSGCAAKWVAGGETTMFGEYDTGTSTECCGDDSGEYFITTGTLSACCNSQTDKLDANGKCVASGYKIYFRTYGGPSCNDVTDENCVKGGDIPSDSAVCAAADNCVFNKKCYAKNTYLDMNSDGKKDAWCMATVADKNKWRDCDGLSASCTGKCAAKWAKGGEKAAFGEYDTGTSTECCGDDKGEYYITTGTLSACCNSKTDIVKTISGTIRCVVPSTPLSGYSVYHQTAADKLINIYEKISGIIASIPENFIVK
jgi:hypothetical protein